MTNFLRGTRPLIIGLIAACTALGTSLASATAASTSNGATTASATASAHAAVHPTTSRLSTLEQLAMLRERAKLAAHVHPAQRGAITGRIVGGYGQPIAGACVTAIGSAGTVLAAAAPDGTFRLAGLASGSYVLEYRDCGAAGRYLTGWSGGTGSRQSAAHVQVTAGQVRHVPVMMLRPASPAALQSNRASWQRMLAAADGRGLTAAAAAKTGRIKGVVTGNGKPLRGMCVVTFPTNGGEGFGATTAKNGSYTIGHVKPGRYDVIFGGDFCPSSSTNWLMQTYRNDNNPFGLGATAVKVVSGKTRTGIDGHLRLGGEISGTVTSRSGRKLAGICVTVTGQVPDGIVGFQTQTGRNGVYHLHALYPGKWSLQFSIGCGSRGNYAPASHRAIRIRYGQDVSGIDAALGTGGTISGKVTLTTSSGAPLSGICVFASNNSGSVNMFATTNAAGRYQVIGLGTGTYQLQFSPGCSNNGNYTTVFTNAHATAGKATRGANAVLQVGGVISGTVTDSHGKPVAGACIELAGSGADTANGPGATGKDGSYVINQLSAGTYEVGFFGGCGSSGSYAPNWYDNQSSQNLATPINLAVAGTFTANAQLQPGATIAGKVTNAAGHGLSGLCVAVAAQTDAQLGPVFEAEAATHDGTYSIPNLAPGQYLVNFGCEGFQAYASQWFGVAPGPGAPELVSAGPGRTGGINGVLRPGGTISGVVTSSSGHPLAGICVAATRIGQPASAVGPASGLNEALTDSHGAYRDAGLAPGSYLVQFSPCAGAFKYAEEWYRDKSAVASATIVKVSASKTTHSVNGRLVVGGSISGRVVNVAAKPVRNVCVLATDVKADFIALTITGKAGTYALPGLGSGSYVLEVTPCASQNLITVLTHASVTQPHATRGVDVTLHPGGTVAGVVTATSSSGPAVPGTCVEVVSSNPANVGSFAITGANGSYQATGLATGSYQVYFGDPLCFLGSPPGLAPQWYDGQPTQATAASITVTAGQTTPAIDAALQPDGEITGTVSAGPSNTPLSGACVAAVPQPADGSPRIVAVSGSSGYALADLVPGRYKVEFSSGCGATGYASQWWKDAASQAAATVVTVGFGQDVSGISATLKR